MHQPTFIMPADLRSPISPEIQPVSSGKNHQPILLTLTLIVILMLAGCGQVNLPFTSTQTPPPTVASEPTSTSLPTSTPSSTSTPLPGSSPGPTTPTPAIIGPAGVEVDCGTGEPTGAALGDDLAVTSASASVLQPMLNYVFTAEFGGVSSIQSPIYSALVLYDPSSPLLDPPAENWYFDNVGNVVYGLVYQPGLPDTTFRAVVSDTGWQESKATQFLASVDGNQLRMRVPAFELPPGAHWAMAFSDGGLTTCETVGIGADNLPALELPPLP